MVAPRAKLRELKISRDGVNIIKSGGICKLKLYFPKYILLVSSPGCVGGGPWDDAKCTANDRCNG